MNLKYALYFHHFETYALMCSIGFLVKYFEHYNRKDAKSHNYCENKCLSHYFHETFWKYSTSRIVLYIVRKTLKNAFRVYISKLFVLN